MSARRQSSAQGFLGACVGIVLNPVPTMRGIVRRRPVGWAFLVIFVVYAAQGVAAQAIVLAGSFDAADFGDVEWLLSSAQILPFIVVPIVAVPVLAFLTAIFWVTSLILGGRGSYSGLFAGLAFASVPTVFSLPANLLASQFWLLSGIVGLGIFAWTLVLTVFAVQENNNFSTGRAIAAVFIPLGILFVLAVALAVFAIVIIVLAVSDGGGWY
jgi:hypothetical protein